MSLLQ